MKTNKLAMANYKCAAKSWVTGIKKICKMYWYRFTGKKNLATLYELTAGYELATARMFLYYANEFQKNEYG